jgi:glycosyltransferase involved in cell wall biosynthesis
MPAAAAHTPATAALFYDPDGYDTQGQPALGRRVAGEEFLRALVRHGGFDRLRAVVRTPRHGEHFQRQVAAMGATVPAEWLPHDEPARKEGIGSLFLPGPGLAQYAWQRRRHRQDAYSLCGVTHTVCTDRTMDDVGLLLVAPTQPWDALVCTSRAGRDMVLRLLREHAAYLKDRFGAARVEGPALPVIPLGVDAEAMVPPPGMREAWRARLGITEGDVAALLLGRLSLSSMVNPLPMYLALGRAAAAPSGTRVHMILAGRFDGEVAERVFRAAAAALAPAVTLHVLDGEMPDLRRTAFAAADFFTILVDNIQETFGLVPVEAMAAGLPVVVSDWDGFRDTVEDGVHGFRVPTLMARGGLDIASRYGVWADGYGDYAAGVGQFVAVDVAAAEAAYRTLIADPERRRAMGAAAQAHARATYEWRVVIGQYRALWDEQARLCGEAATTERARPAAGREAWPLRPDPFEVFAAFPSRRLTPETRFALAPGASPEALRARAAVPGAVLRANLLPALPDLEAVLRRLAQGPASAADLAALAPPQGGRQARLLRALAWMAKLDLVRAEG